MNQTPDDDVEDVAVDEHPMAEYGAVVGHRPTDGPNDEEEEPSSDGVKRWFANVWPKRPSIFRTAKDAAVATITDRSDISYHPIPQHGQDNLSDDSFSPVATDVQAPPDGCSHKESDQDDDNQLRFLHHDDADDNDDQARNFPSQVSSNASSIRYGLLVTFTCSTPTLLGSIWVIYNVTERIWTTLLFCYHLALVMWTARQQCFTLSTYYSSINECQQKNQNANTCCCRWLYCLDLMLFGLLYPVLWTIILTFLLTEPDGATVMEWSSLYQSLYYLRIGSILTFVARCWVALLGKTAATTTSRPPQPRQTLFHHQTRWLPVCNVGLGLAGLLCVWSTYSLIVYWGPWPAPTPPHLTNCNPLDTTECCLPFPSFHHLRRDVTTVTGWRVHFNGTQLAPLRGGGGRRFLDPTFLNQLDGFSTMAPLMFYMQGLKEAQEEGSTDAVHLQGPATIAKSITNESITLLLDVASNALVPHSAEIDYLDPSRPMVLVFPASPLHHNTHYALAVVNAKDRIGNRLHPTVGLQSILTSSSSLNDDDDDHDSIRNRYRNVVMPSLEKAAPWISVSSDPASLHLLFDFHTISAKSQLGPVRAVRDATLRYIRQTWNSNWTDHVHVIRQRDYNCQVNGTWIARTIHATLDVPWFLNGLDRHAVLDDEGVATGHPSIIHQAKFVVHVPCSLRAAALQERGSRPLVAVMEYGHSLFYSRAEASDEYLVK